MINTFAHHTLGLGRVTLAIREDGDKLEVGVAFCSPHDQFSKARGREVASGRLDAKRGFYVVTTRKPDVKLKQQAQDVVELACNKMVNNDALKAAAKKPVAKAVAKASKKSTAATKKAAAAAAKKPEADIFASISHPAPRWAKVKVKDVLETAATTDGLFGSFVIV